MSQINLRLPETLRKKAELFTKKYYYKNIQDLITESLRRMVEPELYATNISKKELAAIDKFAKYLLKKGDFVDADKIFKNARTRK